MQHVFSVNERYTTDNSISFMDMIVEHTENESHLKSEIKKQGDFV